MQPIVPSLFITGTDTDVGKTVLTATLLACLRRTGIQAICMKPFQTGAHQTGTSWRAPDLDLPLRWSNLQEKQVPYDLMAPYCYKPPCSPHLAARQASDYPTLDRVEACFTELTRSYDSILCEGAGGILVPINDKEDMLDIACRLQLPVVVVTRPSLGTLNHTLLTLRALQNSDLNVLGVVFANRNNIPWGDIEKDNQRTIAQRGHTRILGVLPFVDAVIDQPALPKELADAGDQILSNMRI